MLVYVSYYTTSYTTTCGTFIDRFTVRKKNGVGLVWFFFFFHLDNKISCFLFLFRVFYTNCSPARSALSGQQDERSILSPCRRRILPSMYPLDLGRSTPNCYSTTLTRGHTLCKCCSFALYSPSLIVVVLVLLAVRQGRAGPDLAVAVQPLLHHLGDQRVVAPAGALLHGHQDPSLGHAAVQPLPQQLLLLLLVAYLWGTETPAVRIPNAQRRPCSQPPHWILLSCLRFS